jgi:hypothetical protein
VAPATVVTSVNELKAASRRRGEEAAGGLVPGAVLALHGQIVCRRRLAKDLVFFDIRHHGVGAHSGGEAQSADTQTVEVVVSGRAGADAATVKLARSLRQGDVVHVVAALEADDGPKAAAAAAAAAAAGDRPPQVLKVRGSSHGLRVVSKWAELHGQVSFVSTLAAAATSGSQRSKSKAGRKAAAQAPPTGSADATSGAPAEKRKSHPGVKTRRRK